MSLQVVILAAGIGSRMCSDLPKVLHCVGGKPLLQHVLETAYKISTERDPMVVVGHHGKLIKEMFQHAKVHFVEQSEQLGTGHALLSALPHIDPDDQVLVLSGDVPLISVATLQHFMTKVPKDAIGLLTATLVDATGYGRIIREKRAVVAIVEEKDSDPSQLAIKEINAGIYLFPASYLKGCLPTLKNNNEQKEYYLTDVIKCAVKDKIKIVDASVASINEVLGVNDRIQLAHLERCFQRLSANALMKQGVTLLDPNRFDVRGSVKVGRDVTIDVNVILEGDVFLDDNCVIGPNCHLRNVKVGSRVLIKANSVIDGAEIEADSVIGPYARLRPGTVLAKGVHIGNFVEIKNSIVREESKINHLSYIGDSDIGKNVNIGAGTITCNYDGANKHKTEIGDHVHIGSGTQLVAPVSIGEGATIGAGSTLVKNAPANQLTLTYKIEQRSLSDWERPVRQGTEV